MAVSIIRKCLILVFCLALLQPTADAQDGDSNAGNWLSGSNTGSPAGTEPAQGSSVAKKEASFERWIERRPPADLRWSIGYESSTLGMKIHNQALISFGYWMSRTWGLEIYAGLSKWGSSIQEQATEDTDIASNSLTITRRVTGESYPLSITAGGALKRRFYQSEYFQVHGALMATYTLTLKSTSKAASGTRVETYANADDLDNYTASETDWGEEEKKVSGILRAGPRITVQYNLPFARNVALAFSTGVFASLGGTLTSTKTVRTANGIPVVDGTEGDPANGTERVIITETKPDGSVNTFGAGGSSVELNPLAIIAAFSIRYEW